MWGAKVSEVANRLASPWAPRGDLLSRWVDYSGTHRGHGSMDWSAHAIVEDVDTIPGLLGHDRLAYYGLLQERGILKQTVHELNRLQGRAVEVEITRQKDADWSIYYNQALNLIADAKKRQSALQEAAVRQQEWARQLERIRMRADIQNSLDIMRQMVQSACRDDSGLTADDSRNFLLAFDRLFNYGTDEGYPPNAALNGLSGCAWDLLHELLQGSQRLDPGGAEPANEMAHQAYRQYHQTDDVDVDGDPGPSPRGCGNRQPASNGWGSGSYRPCP
ncbi:MAG TPA: hypothetical protein DCZ01_07695 [Elusimicrobia bacterium]|nr:MAG: hypothetical protein A2X37_01325 [Elusimicrobia bacterium GWA2_66_18]HAZ08388.1 hypothetical protein [Elusimicrobiota bacterium]